MIAFSVSITIDVVIVPASWKILIHRKLSPYQIFTNLDFKVAAKSFSSHKIATFDAVSTSLGHHQRKAANCLCRKVLF